MMERFASYAKSTVSLDDDVCERQVCVQMRQKLSDLLQGRRESQMMGQSRQGYTSEIERQGRKITILQKSKELLSEELSLVKQELESTKNKLKKTEEKISQYVSITKESPKRGSSFDYRIVLSEKEEQLEIVCTELKKKEKEIFRLTLQNQQLKEEVVGKQTLLDKIQVSSKVQIDYYRQQIEEYERDLTEKDLLIQENKELNDNLMKMQINKWQQAVHNYNVRMEGLENQLDKMKDKEKTMTTTISNLKQEKCRVSDELNMERQKTIWLQKVLEETKIEFMHAQLKKLEKKDKVAKEKTGVKSKHSYNNENKSSRSVSSVSTALTSTKSRPNQQPSCTAVPPFRLSPQESSIFEPDWPNLLDVSSNQL